MFSRLRRSFLFNLGVVLLLCALLFVAFFAALHRVTGHGKELKIPDVRGKNVTVAINELKALHFDVNVDSTYEPALKPLSVLKQIPDTGSMVKEGRTVFLTVNMLNPIQIPMPNLVGLSYSGAAMLLRNSKLVLGDTSYKPNIVEGAVLEQMYNGNLVTPGRMIQQGSKINLVLGNGAGNTEHNMPGVTDQPLDVALTILGQYQLEVEVISKSQKLIDTAEAMVIDQEPKEITANGAFNQIKNGSKVVLTVE